MSKEYLEALIQSPEINFRPDLRWWLAEGLHTDETLRKNVREIHDNGFGAAEFLAMPEPGADSKVYGWGSPEWTDDTRLIVEETTQLGLGFSLTSGAHWANANLPDTYIWQGEPYNPDNKAAAQELDYATILLPAGERFNGVLPLSLPVEANAGDFKGREASYTKQIFQGVVAAKLLAPRANSGQAFAYAQGEGTGVLDAESLIDLSAVVTGEGETRRLCWTAPSDGTYALFAYWMHGTGQTAKPSVSTNYTISYVDDYGVKALIDYWEEIVLTDSLRETIRKNGRGEIYMDSLELVTAGAGGVYWGWHVREAFQKRKGYDIFKYAPLLTLDGVRVESNAAKQYDYKAHDAAGAAMARKVRMDFYDVLSTLYLENVLKPLQTWLHGLGMTLRAEPSYGMPYEISTPAKYIDGIETESFAQVADVDLYRAMLGSAHMYNRPFSSETGAVDGGNYVFNMDDWTQLCLLQFAAGVNRTVFHGYSAVEGSEADTYWPGHEGMYARFSERFNSRQPASAHYPLWTQMLARLQKLLRQGRPARDIAILRTDYAFINYGQPNDRDDFTKNPFMHDEPHFWRDLSLQRAGYTYDYFSPQLLLDDENVTWNAKTLQPDGPAYRAVLIYQEALELAAARKLLSIAKDGLPVVFVNNNAEILAYDGSEIRHGQAASVSRYLCDSDDDLRAVVAAIKALPNVREANAPADALAALQSLTVSPRAGFVAPNNQILTCSRRDESTGIFYTFAHAYKFRKGTPCAFTLRLEGTGTPYILDAWSGKAQVTDFYTDDGCTCVNLALRPGEAVMLALNTRETRKQDDVNGASRKNIMPSREIPLGLWDIEIEDWNEGDRVVNTEEKHGHITKEVYYTTKKTKLSFPDSTLTPWKDLPATAEQLAALAGDAPSMSHVSGIGTYKTTFEIPADWQGGTAILHFASAGGGSIALWVNGEPAGGMNPRTLSADIGRFLVPGRNTLRVEVASTLTNRLLQRNYGEKQSRWTADFPAIQAYGLAGAAQITLC